MISIKIGDKIKELRLKKELTQDQLAQLLNVSRPTVSSWEVGRNYPDLETLISISDLFNISLDILLREDKKMAENTTNKIKKGKLYKHALIGIFVLFLLYFSYNMKMRFDVYQQRKNLADNGWEQIIEGQDEKSNNFYELTESDINYWTYVLHPGWIGFPLPELKNNTIVANKDNLSIRVNRDNTIRVKISPEKDNNFSKEIYVQTNENVELLKNQEEWSKEYTEQISLFLNKYQEEYKDLIKQTTTKKQVVFE